MVLEGCDVALCVALRALGYAVAVDGGDGGGEYGSVAAADLGSLGDGNACVE